MRGIIIACCLLLLSNTTVTAQIEKPITKKNMYLGGGVYFNMVNNSGDDNSNTHSANLGFKPTFGYFVIDRLAVGISPFITNSAYRSESYQVESNYLLEYDIETKTLSAGVAPAIKYYFKNAVFVETELEYSYNNRVLDSYITRTANGSDLVLQDDRTVSSYNKLGASFGVGYSYFINSKVSIDASLKYNKELYRHNKTTDSNISNSSTKTTSQNNESGIYFLIGLQVFL